MGVVRELKLIEPIRLRAEVVHGFGRGSRQLGFPTANLRIPWEASEPKALTVEEKAILNFASTHSTGIYCALCCLETDPSRRVYKVAMSMGWNPTFTDVKAKTIEPWILHKFSDDFYGSYLRLLVLGYVRPELKFSSLDELIAEISADGEYCRDALDRPELVPFQSDPFFQPGRLPPDVVVSCSLRPTLTALPLPRPDVTRLMLVRHGETLANAQGLLCGGGDDSELSHKGRAQAELLAEELAQACSSRPQLVGSSTLRRAVDSADAIARRFPQAERLMLPELGEMRYGRLEGVPIADARGEMSATSRLWRSGHTERSVGDGGGESPDEVVRRTLAAVEELLRGRQGQSVILVCHSWVNKALIASVTPGLGLAGLLEVPQRNCAVNVLDVRETPNGQHFEVLGVDLLASDAKEKL